MKASEIKALWILAASTSPLSCSEVGAALWGAEGEVTPAYASSASRVLKGLAALGFAQEGQSRKGPRWSVTEAGRREAEQNKPLKRSVPSSPPAPRDVVEKHVEGLRAALDKILREKDPSHTWVVFPEPFKEDVLKLLWMLGGANSTSFKEAKQWIGMGSPSVSVMRKWYMTALDRSVGEVVEPRQRPAPLDVVAAKIAKELLPLRQEERETVLSKAREALNVLDIMKAR